MKPIVDEEMLKEIKYNEVKLGYLVQGKEGTGKCVAFNIKDCIYEDENQKLTREPWRDVTILNWSK